MTYLSMLLISFPFIYTLENHSHGIIWNVKEQHMSSSVIPISQCRKVRRNIKLLHLQT